ncbi:Lupeol synthase [Stylosanthes scabra]|uniref:Lupeol synthase n=1 Tax=Stylosanthes scabra TaxID=79078 RepID=A0ABU6U0M5_9FABA|nr:Lupeol synthase [Stylosanthes scabra]
MFGSGMSYIALRILGEELEDHQHKPMSRARKWILDHGGLLAIPSWGKFWVSVLGVYEWSGCNPFPPELWLIPKSSPFQPGGPVLSTSSDPRYALGIPSSRWRTFSKYLAVFQA